MGSRLRLTDQHPSVIAYFTMLCPLNQIRLFSGLTSDTIDDIIRPVARPAGWRLGPRFQNGHFCRCRELWRGWTLKKCTKYICTEENSLEKVIWQNFLNFAELKGMAPACPPSSPRAYRGMNHRSHFLIVYCKDANPSTVMQQYKNCRARQLLCNHASLNTKVKRTWSPQQQQRDNGHSAFYHHRLRMCGLGGTR